MYILSIIYVWMIQNCVNITVKVMRKFLFYFLNRYVDLSLNSWTLKPKSRKLHIITYGFQINTETKLSILLLNRFQK